MPAHDKIRDDLPAEARAMQSPSPAAALLALGPVSEALRPYVNGLDPELAAMSGEPLSPVPEDAENSPARPSDASEATDSIVARPSPEALARFQSDLRAMVPGRGLRAAEPQPPLVAAAPTAPPPGDSIANPPRGAPGASDATSLSSDARGPAPSPADLARLPGPALSWFFELPAETSPATGQAAAPPVGPRDDAAGAAGADSARLARLLAELVERHGAPALADPSSLFDLPPTPTVRDLATAPGKVSSWGVGGEFGGPPALGGLGRPRQAAGLGDAGLGVSQDGSAFMTSRHAPGGEGFDELAARLLAAVERLEQAASRLSSRSVQNPAPPPARRTFRGRVGD